MPQFTITVDEELSCSTTTAVCVSAPGELPQSLTLCAYGSCGPLGQLIGGLLRLLGIPYLPQEKVSIVWDDDQEQWRWILRRKEDRVQIEIRHFKEALSRLPDEKGELCLETECTMLRLATQVKGQYLRMCNAVSDEAPQRGHSSPPDKELSRLVEWIEQEKQRQKEEAGHVR